MKTTNITKNTCDRPGCKSQESVTDGEKPKVTWYEVTLDSKFTFDFCGKCALEIFGDQCVDLKEVAAEARHLRSDEEILADVDEQTKRTQALAPKEVESMVKLGDTG